MTPEYDLYAKFEKNNESQYRFLCFIVTPYKTNNSNITYYGKYYKPIISNYEYKRVIAVPKNLMNCIEYWIDETTLDEFLIDFEIIDIKIPDTRRNLNNYRLPEHYLKRVHYVSKIE